jgi:hypothetical protein
LAAAHRSKAFSSEEGTGSREENASKRSENLVLIDQDPGSRCDQRPVRDGWNGAADIL